MMPRLRLCKTQEMNEDEGRRKEPDFIQTRMPSWDFWLRGHHRLTKEGVCASFILTWHKPESLGRGNFNGEKCPKQISLLANLWYAFLIDNRWGKAQVTVGGVPWVVGPRCYKEAGSISHGEQVSQQHPSIACFSSCLQVSALLEFLPWLPSILAVRWNCKLKWTFSSPSCL